MKRKAALTFAMGTAALLALSGCVVNDAEPASEGEELGGSLTVACGAMEDWCQAMTAAFQEKTGVETSFVRLSSGETVARLESAKDSPEFDVWHGGPADGYGMARDAGLLEQYSSPNADAIPEKYKDADGYWTGVYVGALGFCSNQSVLDKLGVDAPESWRDLLDPKLKGQVSTAHPSTSGTAFTALWTQVTLNGGDEDKAMEYMRGLHNNILQYSKSGTAPGQTAGRGEVAVGLVFSHDCVKYQEAGMTDLVVSFPEEGTGYEIGGVGVVKGSKNPAAAKAYVDWTLTPEAQNLGVTVGSYQIPTNPDSTRDERMVNLDEVKLVDYDFDAASKAKKELTQRFDAEIAAQPRE
ncbi:MULTISPECIES: ABC transporter substrate-binding protein [unclassified Arthrobacter]|uniref:ABC transporter substrate-binding protein n=1 Tax=unclassified Arthrobacter TaxID=235627 RepID=UPI001D13C472|nr:MULTISPECIES: ABC transporter substrate-binding protein [unclassified Arthrobacter]MCC3275716.1 ABC transporter substrate-binding protein [Arthrobacter sp. zg-Y20]MCC9177233.1 ABC transporter substrate-binding protein [Arthrobacter sp. zg-Y750]MDK1315873.1 ABC transporter substrate-binding protein [Arthrobacter sp. zg.Y20]WIB06342.1 ABC transporter substrate-binding protein [Arthrobacter sp. zg-Y20]